MRAQHTSILLTFIALVSLLNRDLHAENDSYSVKASNNFTKESTVTNQGYCYECKTGNFSDEDFSEWVPITDMQIASDNMKSDRIWLYVEGRNHNGLDQYRWVEKKTPPNYLNCMYDTRAHQTSDDFYNRGMKLRAQGYERMTLQVFVDSSGVARHQALWLKLAPSNEEKDSTLLLQERLTNKKSEPTSQTKK